jgi:hypothetical protein
VCERSMGWYVCNSLGGRCTEGEIEQQEGDWPLKSDIKLHKINNGAGCKWLAGHIEETSGVSGGWLI